MNLTHLIWREMAHRRLNFSLMLVSVVLAVGCGVSAVTWLRAQALFNQRQVKVLDDEIRKITKNMGFNIVILPQEQNLSDFYADDFGARTMPEAHVQTLAASRDVFTIQHLRPALIRKIDWPEQNRRVIMMGVRGIVPFVHRDAKKPLADPVPPGKVDVGHVLAQELGLAPGQQLTLMEQTLEVNKVYPPRGNKDDITIWIDLEKAQQLLDMPGKINMIQALECNCGSVDRLAEIEAEVSGVLGDQVQVIELTTKAIARAKARTRVSEEGVVRLERWQRVASAIIPLTVVAAGTLVGLLSLANVRQRRQELGVLRALGMRSTQVFRVLLAKPAVIGLLGALVGYLLGFGAAYAAESICYPEAAGDKSVVASLFQLPILAFVFVLTPVLTVMAGWLPALYAAGQDPAEILHEE